MSHRVSVPGGRAHGTRVAPAARLLAGMSTGTSAVLARIAPPSIKRLSGPPGRHDCVLCRLSIALLSTEASPPAMR